MDVSMAVNVQQETVDVEAYLHDLVEKQDDPSLKEHVSQAMKSLDRLTAAHDAALASVVRPSVDLKSLLRQFTAKSMALKESRGEKRAIATLMASGDLTNPDVLLDDLKTLVELPDDAMHTNSEEDSAFVVHKMIEEFNSRQELRDKLQLLQSDRDAIQRVVSRKTESVTKLAGMVHEIGNKANEALLNLSVDPIKLPQKKAVTQKDLPGPLYVLFSQFSNIKAVYDDQVQVEVSDSISEMPGDQVEVTIPAPAESQLTACTVCFGFSAKMSTVLAHSPSHPEMLRQYDPNDTGEQWPHLINPLQDAGSPQPEVPIKCKPFRWCQKLSGLDLPAQRSNSATEVHDAILGRTAEGFMWRIQQLLIHV